MRPGGVNWRGMILAKTVFAGMLGTFEIRQPPGGWRGKGADFRRTTYEMPPFPPVIVRRRMENRLPYAPAWHGMGVAPVGAKP